MNTSFPERNWTAQIAPKSLVHSTKKRYLNCGFVVGKSESKMVVVESNVSPYPVGEISLRLIIQLNCWTLHGLDWKVPSVLPFRFQLGVDHVQWRTRHLGLQVLIHRVQILKSQIMRESFNYPDISPNPFMIQLEKTGDVELEQPHLTSIIKKERFWNWLSNEIATAYHNCLRHIRPSKASSAYWGWKSLWKRRKCKNPSGVLGCLTPKRQILDAGRFGVPTLAPFRSTLWKSIWIYFEFSLERNTLALLGPTSKKNSERIQHRSPTSVEPKMVSFVHIMLYKYIAVRTYLDDVQKAYRYILYLNGCYVYMSCVSIWCI